MVLKNCREIGDITEAEALVLSERAGNALCAKAEAEDVCLGMVDFWPGNILVELGEFGRCGLIDWEYFGLTSASSELGMLRKLLFVFILPYKILTLNSMFSLDSCSSPCTVFKFHHHCRCSEQSAIICQSHLRSIRTVSTPAGSIVRIQTSIADISWARDGEQCLSI
jgi:hypothetical protein